jgi:hypothetical protein
MSPLVLGLVLAAAFAHAGWNFLAKGADGAAAFVWLCAVAGTVLYVPALAIALGTDPGEIGWTALGLMAGSGVLHTLYFVLLQRGYAAGDLSLVYPLARGTGPLLSRPVGPASPRRSPHGVDVVAAQRGRRRTAEPARLRADPLRARPRSVTYVAPARETSILIGTLLGTTALAEGDTLRRLLAAGAIVVGVTALALG